MIYKQHRTVLAPLSSHPIFIFYDISHTFGFCDCGRKGSYDAALLSFDWQQDHTAKVEYSVEQLDESSSTNSHSAKTTQNIHQDVTYYTPHTQHGTYSKGRTDGFISYSERAAQGFADRNRMKKFDWTRDQLAKAHESSGPRFFTCSAIVIRLLGS